MKPVDVKLSIYIDFNRDNNKEGLELKVNDHVRISKYKNVFAKTMCLKKQNHCAIHIFY